ncbi:MAG: murein transglycosylase-like protein [Firmicutes bacterium]|nr:murein transglycosylase-like protein [Bacillota bacterium]
MLRRLRLRRSFWAAVAAGLALAPALFGGVAAAPADGDRTLPPPDQDPRLTLPPHPAQIGATEQVEGKLIADLAPEEFRPLVVTAAKHYGIDPRLLAAIATVETEWNPNAVGTHGELGLTQILPETGAWLAELAGLKEYNLADPETSLSLSALYLSLLLKEYGTPEKALACYNGGPSAVADWETNLYARRVLKHYRPGSRPTPQALMLSRVS